ncbi:penicillin-binding protein [Brevibacillus laterosporus]|uniref:Penicillin-binding protein n=1 Tax=Brevibacillus laterosporus TaxID=1465 RepID=A0A502J2P5_BRELA|nr:transglycosylase domain-containing protein [Brevibacillus laterosporus]QDX92612.1 penicillin-binding protein [Brevibacillus laterosporus]RAP27850.1 Multimodular transpeptidase-transglycosylase [Brevibacillus laterosporus]TPG70924.1 penicillin-binding protein [Brevibacillus laterosporus]TPG93209.1 penicillin-binding protein [Brevibacillus laterosporus]
MNHVLQGTAQPLEQSKHNTWRTKVPKWLVIFLVAALFLQVIVYSTITIAGTYLIDQQILTKTVGSSLGGQGTYVAADEMPTYLKDAFIAIEDHRYYNHKGIDYIAFGRALWINTMSESKRQGGSTISMQLARNLFLTNEKTYTRKLKEAFIAMNLERQFTKDEIVEMYLNNIYFGHGKYGIEAAAQHYFGKTVRLHDPKFKTINESEAAMLAALPKAPENYSPIKYPDKAMTRQHVVLSRMKKLGYITNKQEQEFLKQKIIIKTNGNTLSRVASQS